ncbi:MAG TPA: terminase small subunit [Clostridia bacterium]|nr:terminase small subunit [Clostridia bacterium]
MKNKKLSLKERLFCVYFVENRNAREAAAKSGYKLRPDIAAIKLLMREDIQKEIAEISAKPICTSEVIAGYRRLAFGSTADALKLICSEKTPSNEELEKMDMFNVSEIKRPKNGGLEIKFFDRLKPLERLQTLSEHESGSSGAENLYRALEHGAQALSNKN